MTSLTPPHPTPDVPVDLSGTLIVDGPAAQDAVVGSAEASRDGGATWIWDERIDATRVP